MTITILEYLIIWLSTSATIYSIVRVAEMITDIKQKTLLKEIERLKKDMKGEE